MKLRCDYAVREHVPFESVPWSSSPGLGVERKMLERDGDEVARATSIVRYARGSAFAEHVHERGEEFIVLEGTFQDEHGDYPAGTYVRNPPGSSHRPFAKEGCTIFVKLRQFAEGDQRHVVLLPGEGSELHVHGPERVSLVELAPGATLALVHGSPGIELLVLHGSLTCEHERCDRLAWLRIPDCRLDVTAGTGGCRLWLKQGHLPLPTQNTNVPPTSMVGMTKNCSAL